MFMNSRLVLRKAAVPRPLRIAGLNFRCICYGIFSLILFAASTARSQEPAAGQQNSVPASQATVTTADIPEISTSTVEQTTSFQVKVNLVEVRVVVRNAQGKAIGDLKQDDFILLDDKKPQTITRFSIERNEPATTKPGATESLTPSDEVRSHLAGSWRLAYLFDDFNATPNDLTNARKAADQAIDSLAPGELLGIFTLSGQGTQDFTGDKERLRAAVQQLQPRPQAGSRPGACPPIDYYIADQIVNYSDARALNMVTAEVLACQFEGHANDAAQPLARQAAQREVSLGESQGNLALHTFNDVVRHVSSFAGQRTLVFLSPGFYVGRPQQAALTDSLDRAIRSGVVVSTLDLRGVAPGPLFGTDISEKGSGTAIASADMLQYKQSSNLAQSDPLMQMANATGGKYLHNTNDISGGLSNMSAPPEVSYLLGFTPQNMQNDGKFHTLKVELKQTPGYTVQARKGYYAPSPGGSSEQVKREVAEAVFAHDEIHELPLRVQTQFFRAGDNTAKVLVLVHVDVRHMQFKKSDGRNLNELTIVSAVFDRNANFVTAKSSTVKMHIKDETLDTKLNSGITVKSNFDVNPGSYLVRVVARDEQGKMLTQNEVVDIP
jgi:VWFA-related protein